MRRIKMAGMLVLCVLLVMVFIAGISAGVNQWLKPSPEETRAEVLKIIQEGGLIEILSDFQYDDTYFLMELKDINLEILRDFVRPIKISLVENKNIFFQTVMTGLLIDRYILTSSQPFWFLFYPGVQEAIAAGVLGVEIKLSADTNREDAWKFESIEIENIIIGENVAVLERGESLNFPTPTQFPFRLGRIEDLNLGDRQDKLYGIGSFPLGEGRNALHPYEGTVEFVQKDEGIIVFSSALVDSDFGGPIFALRDGEPELIGLVQFGEGGKARAIDMRTILKELKEAGLEIDIKFKD